MPGLGGALEQVQGFPAIEESLDPHSQAAALWAYQKNRPAGRDTDTLPAADWMFLPLATQGAPMGAVGLRFLDPSRRLDPETRRLLASMAEFPDRAHLVGAYALGKAQRVIALVRQAGHDGPIHLHGAVQRLTDYHVEQGIALGDLRPATVPKEIEGQLVIAPPSAFASPWVQRFRDPVIGFASGWMTVRQRARQRQQRIHQHCSGRVQLRITLQTAYLRV